MKFPYGTCNFYKIITEGCFYMDRTDRIPLIEEAGDQLLFLRPRRFGKSLLLSVLENYYDIAGADEFERLFGKLAIGKNPTPRHSRYFVMKWDFSTVSPAGDVNDIQKSLYDHINGCIKSFALTYSRLLDTEIEISPHNAPASFQSLLTSVRQASGKLFLLIDEYDNFANEVMTGSAEISQSRYKALVYGEGCLKTVFKNIKAAAAGLGLERAFITGVSPVVMSDITSGYNIAENIYLKPEFNDLCGFTEPEIRDVLNRIVSECDFQPEKADEALSMMKTFYNGYNFRGAGHVYNPTLSLYFMKHFHQYCEYPQEMLDENLAMDRGKIRYISGLPGGEQVIAGALNDPDILSIQSLHRRFGVEDMLYAVKDRTFMVSLLYYFGVLTFSGRKTDLGESVLKIPNLVIRKLYAERIREMLVPDAGDEILRITGNFYLTGDLQPLCDFMERRYFKVFDNRDYRWANELTVKTAFLTLLYNDFLYIMDSEPALERAYADLSMIIRPDMRQYKVFDFLFEFKYVSLQDVGCTGDQVRAKTRDELAALPKVKEKLAEAERGLEGYCRILRETYGGLLRLKAYSVAAVGFDRIVWKEVSFGDTLVG